MSASRRRRVSKWDVVENILPENDRDIAHSNSDRISFHEHESKDHMSGKLDIQKAERMNDESIPGNDGDGHCTKDPNGRKQQNQSQSASRSRSRSYRSRSRSRSRSKSRSPVHNPQPKPFCRDFAAGRCRKGELCHFAHHGRSDHESKRRLEARVGSAQESTRRDDDEAVRSHSSTYSTGGRPKNVCGDFLKGRCRRGASCKYPHHDSGYDEFGKGSLDGRYQDGDNGAISKDGHSYSRKNSQDDRQPKHNTDGARAKDDTADNTQRNPYTFADMAIGGANGKPTLPSKPRTGDMRIPYEDANLDAKTAEDQNNVTGGDFVKVGSSGDKLGHHSANLNSQGTVIKEENNGGVNDAQGAGPREDMKDGVNDAKKVKDAKEFRPFKFELAEFVKELLRPTWKEGQMSKEVYKTIVKKVVDKVSDSIQAEHVPRTKEKIDQYLSFSKPKLSKLVQAYLERYKKPSSGPNNSKNS